MRTLLVILFLLFGAISTVQAQTCYYYISQFTDKEFVVYKGEALKKIYTNIISADCDEMETAISNEYHDALKAEYPESYIYTGSLTVWGPFDTQGEAKKQKRERMGEDRTSDFKTIDFDFAYYGN